MGSVNSSDHNWGPHVPNPNKNSNKTFLKIIYLLYRIKSFGIKA